MPESAGWVLTPSFRLCTLGASVHLSKPEFLTCEVGVTIVGTSQVAVGSKGDKKGEKRSLTHAQCSKALSFNVNIGLTKSCLLPPPQRRRPVSFTVSASSDQGGCVTSLSCSSRRETLSPYESDYSECETIHDRTGLHTHKVVGWFVSGVSLPPPLANRLSLRTSAQPDPGLLH